VGAAVAAALIGIALIVVLVGWAKLHPFLSLAIGALATGAIAGMDVAAASGSFGGGFGTTIGILIALGAKHDRHRTCARSAGRRGLFVPRRNSASTAATSLLLPAETRTGTTTTERVSPHLRTAAATTKKRGSGRPAIGECRALSLLRATCEQDNELTLFVGPGGQAIFSEIAILYTSNKLTVTRPVVLEPTLG
jgi:hypothetical protein